MATKWKKNRNILLYNLSVSERNEGRCTVCAIYSYSPYYKTILFQSGGLLPIVPI